MRIETNAKTWKAQAVLILLVLATVFYAGTQYQYYSDLKSRNYALEKTQYYERGMQSDLMIYTHDYYECRSSLDGLNQQYDELKNFTMENCVWKK